MKIMTIMKKRLNHEQRGTAGKFITIQNFEYVISKELQ